MKSFINSNSFYPNGGTNIIELQNLKVFQVFESHSVPLAKRLEKGYGYGYTGMERDDEAKGSGNQYTTHFRQYDPRLGRWFSTDPKEGHPYLIGWSPYHYSYNNPMVFVDTEGDIPWDKVLAAFKRVSSEQGYRKHPISGKREGHGGMDIAANTGTKVRVMADGEIVKVGWDSKVVNGKTRGYGRYVVVKHKNGYYTLYAHLEKDGTTVKVGDKVSDGDVIATSGNSGGSTGPHLHLEVIKASSLSGVFNWENKMNPRDFGDLQEFLENGGKVTNTSASTNSNMGSNEMKSYYQENIGWADEMINTMQGMNDNGVFDTHIQNMQDYKTDQQTKLNELGNGDGN